MSKYETLLSRAARNAIIFATVASNGPTQASACRTARPVAQLEGARGGEDRAGSISSSKALLNGAGTACPHNSKPLVTGTSYPCPGTRNLMHSCPGGTACKNPLLNRNPSDKVAAWEFLVSRLISAH